MANNVFRFFPGGYRYLSRQVVHVHELSEGSGRLNICLSINKHYIIDDGKMSIKAVFLVGPLTSGYLLAGSMRARLRLDLMKTQKVSAKVFCAATPT